MAWWTGILVVSIIIQGNMWGEWHMEKPNSHDGIAECQHQEREWRQCIAIRPLYDATSVRIADPTLAEGGRQQVRGMRDGSGWICMSQPD